jgi:hypothetical protein
MCFVSRLVTSHLLQMIIVLPLQLKADCPPPRSQDIPKISSLRGWALKWIHQTGNPNHVCEAPASQTRPRFDDGGLAHTTSIDLCLLCILCCLFLLSTVFYFVFL